MLFAFEFIMPNFKDAKNAKMVKMPRCQKKMPKPENDWKPNFLYFLKKHNFRSISGRFFVFSIHFAIGSISYWKTNFKILNVYILVKRPLEKLHLQPQWGPDTHYSPHQRGAVSKAEQTLSFAHKPFLKLSKASQSLIRLNIQSLPSLNIIIFDEVKHSIKDFKTFVEYFSFSNWNTDRQVITGRW